MALLVTGIGGSGKAASPDENLFLKTYCPPGRRRSAVDCLEEGLVLHFYPCPSDEINGG